MSRKEFDALPYTDELSSNYWDSIVVYPNRKLHESGYRTITVIGVKKDCLQKCVASCDVLHLDGISGGKSVKHTGWNIDYLPKSGLMHMFVWGKKIKTDLPISSFEIIAVDD